MKRRDFLGLLSAPLALQLNGCSGGDANQSGDRSFPRKHKQNVLFVAVDDLNDWLGLYTQEIAPGIKPYTPNFDEFAKSSIVFDNAYTPIALCNPARTAIWNGIAPHRSGVFNNHSSASSEFYHKANCHFDNRLSLNAFFKNQGYKVYGIGKLWHGNTQVRTDGNWDEYISAKSGSQGACRVLYTNDHPSGELVDYDSIELGSYPSDQCPSGLMHADAYVANSAVRKLRDSVGSSNPFFLGVGFVRPHWPYYTPGWCFDKYPISALNGWMEQVRADNTDFLNPKLAQYFSSQTNRVQRLLDANEMGKFVQGYLASITYVDHLFGRLVAELKASGLWENTNVVVWSDHGYHQGAKRMLHKNTLWERAVKVPFMVRVPGHFEGERTNAIVSMQDLYPTLTDLCFDTIPNDVDGKSILPVLADLDAQVHDHVLSAVSLDGNTEDVSSIGAIGYSVTNTEKMRYTVYRLKQDDGTTDLIEELYNVSADPQERNNLIASGYGTYSKLVQNLRSHVPMQGELIAPLPELSC